MIIREVDLKNFGKFQGKRLTFSPGLNVIYGANEAGKTTVYHAILGLLFGMEKQRGRAARNDVYTTYQPWENKTWYEGSMRFETGGKLFYLERTFYHQERSARLVCESDGEELSVAQGDLEMLLGETGAELYTATAAVGQLKMKPQELVYRYLNNLIAGVQEAGSRTMDVEKALAILENKKKVLEQQIKQQTLAVREQIAKNDTASELLEKEIQIHTQQLETAKRTLEAHKAETPLKPMGFWIGLLLWIRRLLFGKRLRREEKRAEELRVRQEEKIRLWQDLLGEKESRREELALEKEACYARLSELSKNEEVQAIALAMERIRELSMKGKEEIMEELLKKSSDVLAQITNGSCRKLLLDENRELSVWKEQRKVPLFQLSAGCVDQVYLAFRIGLQDLFFREDVLPLMLDDAFVLFDEQRLERLLLYLSGLDRQVLIFTCHQREAKLLERHGISYGKHLL